MKTKRLVSMIGSALLVLSPSAWADHHFGGGGGFHSGFSHGMPGRQSRTFGRADFGRVIAPHIAERHDADWHRDWDRRHGHFDHHRFFVFVDGFWCGLDDGFFPWDYYPYYAYEYYPYDYYYPGYYGGDGAYYRSQNVYGYMSLRDPTVNAVQGKLAQLGYYKGPIDGLYGRLTRDAVARYQFAKKLEVSGSLSAQTLHSLGLREGTPS